MRGVPLLLCPAVSVSGHAGLSLPACSWQAGGRSALPAIACIPSCCLLCRCCTALAWMGPHDLYSSCPAAHTACLPLYLRNTSQASLPMSLMPLETNLTCPDDAFPMQSYHFLPGSSKPKLHAFCLTELSCRYFIYLAWIPTFFVRTLGVNLRSSSFLSFLPWTVMAVGSSVAGVLADGLIQRGWSVTHVRKALQTVAFLGPAAALMVLSGTKDPRIAVASMTCALGITSLGKRLGCRLLADCAGSFVWLGTDAARWCRLAPTGNPAACCQHDLHPGHHLVRQV